MAFTRLIGGAIGATAVIVGLTLFDVRGQEQARPLGVEIPATATTLEGIPTVRIDSAEHGVTRRVLGEAEAAKDRLTVRVRDGQFYWASRDNRLLRLDSSGPYTYLSSEPGRYIRFTRLNDRIAYVEHVEMPIGSVTWWGELEIVVRK